MSATFGSSTRRQPLRLQLAQQKGFLNARCLQNPELVRAYGLWCWQMAVPMVWFERCSPNSRFSRVHLEMLTTPFMLSVSGHAALIALSASLVKARDATISPHGAVWDRVPLADTAAFARSIFRAVRRAGSYHAPAEAQSLTPIHVVPFTTRLAKQA
jgi:hypothetical protein